MNGYAIILGFGCVLSLWNMTRRSGGQLAPVALLIMGLAFLGARAGYVLLRLPYYSQHLLEIPRFSSGGLDGPCAMLAGLLGFALAAAAQRGAFLCLLEETARLVVPLSLAVWLGCWVAGTAYGPPIPFPALAWLDRSPAGLPHWPLPLLAALALGWVSFWLDGHLLRWKDNGRGFFYLLSAALCLLLVSLFRQDEPAPFWNGMRLDILESTLLSLAFLAASLVAWVKIERKLS
jgi:phosphatidylglycerol---prolipoprotein diacylglyceryl transferase